MQKSREARPMVSGVVRLLAVLAVLATGFAGMRLIPTMHATASHAAQPAQLVIDCPSATTHC